MDEKKAYEQKIEAEIDKWKAELDKLKARRDSASADIKIRMEKQLKELSDMQKEAEDKLGQLRNSGEKAWEDVKSGAREAAEAYEKSVKAAVARFL
ncbi:MAG: coiled coil domain-containing protein [Gammaproteobacteria bacterium]|nr:coiled coil domain-containing protein [Gammaproteobacteria bacterium]